MLEMPSMTGTLIERLGITIVSLEPSLVVATMPVDERTRQPFGVLHGGASVALAETVASIGTAQSIDLSRQIAMGLEINANHLRAKSAGIVTAKGVPIHRGRTTYVWDIRLTDEDDRLICISRCTVAIRDR